MANYTIIGGDGKEYGPVTGGEIRQWISEGRLDGNSRARSENDTEWRSLSAFPEFTTAFQPRPSSPPPFAARPVASPQGNLQAVKAPAIALIVVGALGVLVALWSTVSELIHPTSIDQFKAAMASMPQFNDAQFQKELNDPQVQSLLNLFFSSGVRIGSCLFALVMSGIILWGATRMLAGRNFEFACVAAIMAMIPCLTPSLCCCFGLPIGIWALIVLFKPGVKGQFL